MLAFISDARFECIACTQNASIGRFYVCICRCISDFVSFNCLITNMQPSSRIHTDNYAGVGMKRPTDDSTDRQFSQLLHTAASTNRHAIVHYSMLILKPASDDWNSTWYSLTILTFSCSQISFRKPYRSFMCASFQSGCKLTLPLFRCMFCVCVVTSCVIDFSAGCCCALRRYVHNSTQLCCW